MAKAAEAAEAAIQPGAPAGPEIDSAPFEGGDAAPVKPKGEGEPAAKKDPDPLTEARKEIDRLSRANQELSASERYWAQRAQGNLPRDGEGAEEDDEGEPPAAGKPEAEPEPENPDEFLDELSKRGPAAIAAALEKRGYVRKQDVQKIAAEIAERIVQRQAGKLAGDAKLVSQYPDLQDENSELFKATAPIYRKLVELDPKLKSSQATLFLAAEQAKLQLELAKSREKRPSGDYREDEEDRTTRIRGQMGPTGRGRSAPLEEDEDDMIGPAQREVINMFPDVDEASYVAERAKQRTRRR